MDGWMDGWMDRVCGKCDMQSGLLPAGGGLGGGKSKKALSGLQLPPTHVSPATCMPACLLACPPARLHAHSSHACIHACACMHDLCPHSCACTHACTCMNATMLVLACTHPHIRSHVCIHTDMCVGRGGGGGSVYARTLAHSHAYTHPCSLR